MLVSTGRSQPQSAHLEHVVEAFQRLGYQHASSSEQNWSILWAFHSPFVQREGEPDIPAILHRLEPTQLVNQLPGAAAFTSKFRLASASHSLPFLPPSFQLPADAERFKEYAADNPASEWVLKDGRHRGVQFVSNAAQALAEADALKDEQDVFVQRLIRPFLIDSKLWDVGLYVAVTSVAPLRVYIYDNVLMRHCSENYTQDLSGAPPGAYVIAERYSPPWSLPSLRPYYARGLSTLNVVRAYMHDQGRDFDELLSAMKARVLRLLWHFEPALRSAAAAQPHGSRSFFALYRADFLVDKDFQPWLVEVNQSPNLSSAAKPDLKNMFQRLAYSLLSLMGLAAGQLRYSGNTADQIDMTAHHNDVDIGWRICSNCTESCDAECVICRRCRTPEQTRMIQETVSEHNNRQGFMHLFPLDSGMAARTDLQDIPVLTPDDHFMHVWLREKCLIDYTWC